MALEHKYLSDKSDPRKVADLCGRFYLQYARSYLDQHCFDYDYYSNIFVSLGRARSCFVFIQNHELILETEIITGYVYYTMRTETAVKRAEEKWRKAISLLQESKQKIGPKKTAAFFHRIRQNQANIDFVRTNYFEAKEKYLRCVAYYLKHDNYTKVCDIKKALGDCCRALGQYQEAAQHYLEYLEYEELSTTDQEFKQKVRDDILTNLLEDIREDRMGSLFESAVEFLHYQTDRSPEEILNMILKFSEKQ